MQSDHRALKGARNIRFPALALLILLGLSSRLSGQTPRSLIEGGNEAYDSDDFVEAEINYRKALEKDDALPEGHFNLGDALYKQGKYDRSAEAFERAIEDTSGSDIMANSLFNKGNSLFKQQKYNESVDAYVNSLKLSPDDLDAKYNLLHAIKKLEEQESSQEDQESQPEQGDEGQEKKEKQDQQQGQQDGEERDEAGEKRRPDNQEEKQSDQEQEEKQPARDEEREMSRAEAERILQALKESDMDVQKKLRKVPEGRAMVEKDW